MQSATLDRASIDAVIDHPADPRRAARPGQPAGLADRRSGRERDADRGRRDRRGPPAGTGASRGSRRARSRTTRAALTEAADAPVVVAVGGDGTVREAADALIGRETPLAIVPAGTGNVLAGAIGIRGVRSALDALRHGRSRTIDLGRARWAPAGG